ncbi:MAG: LPS assembly protein LptD [Parvularculaceae bacterium]
MHSSRLIARLLATSALAGAWIFPAALHAAELTVGEKGKGDAATDKAGETVLFEADHVTREDDDSPIVAEGNVRAYFGERYLRADKLTYNPATNIVIAEGEVSITDEHLQTIFAGRVEITGDLRDGIVENFSALLEDNARLAGAAAYREQGARTKLRDAVYTACNVCKANGEAKTPTWRIRALRVTRDEERKVVRFYHAFLELKGIPILYTPFAQAPDPSVERQSGFLTPQIGASSRLGFNLELPYYLAISNHQDATFSPKYTSTDGVLWQGEYRRRDDHAYQVFQGGFINPSSTASNPGVPGVRWHVFASGYRDFGSRWRAGYDVERVSDDTYLRRYDVQRTGDLRKELDTSQTNRLRTNTFLRWTAPNSDFTANSYLFQNLRTITVCDLADGQRIDVPFTTCNSLIPQDPAVTVGPDIAKLTPYVLPTLNFNHYFEPPEIGGQATINVNFASLQRTGGTDTKRLTASAYWEREFFTSGGHRFKTFAELRGDAFRYSDLNEGTENRQGIAQDNSLDARFAPSVGAEWSYPLTRRAAGARLFIEPRVQLVASPSQRNQTSIINEDSQSVEFDYAGLFLYNKATGYDAFEDGQRMNVGVAASADFDFGLKIDGEIGEQFRLQSTSAFDPTSGLGDTRSDYVGSLNIRYRNVIGIENRFRLTTNGLSLARAESLAYFNFWRLRTNLSYVRLRDNIELAGVSEREELNARATFKITDHWNTGFSWRQDLVADRPIRQNFSLGYQDECSSIQLIYSRDRTQDVNLPSNNRFLVRFTLRSLVN